MENFKSLFKPKCIKTFLLMTFFPFAQGGYMHIRVRLLLPQTRRISHNSLAHLP